MSIQIRWFDEKKSIVHYEFVGVWTWEDLHLVLNKATEMGLSVSHPIDAIVDLTRNGSTPMGALLNLRQITSWEAVTWNTAVLIGANPVTRGVIATFRGLYPRLGARYHTANSIPEAVEIIRRRRQVLLNNESIGSKTNDGH